MDILTSTLQGVWPILVFGILLGAGMPAVFALGLRIASPAAGSTADGTTAVLAPVGTGRKIAAGLCFAVVAFAALGGIAFLVLTGHR